LSSNGDRSAVLSRPTGSGYYRTVARLWEIASAAEDGTVKIWDATHGPEADAAKAARPPTGEPH
jgi:hypothetical protein